MVIRSLFIWFVVLIVWGFLISPGADRQEAEELRLAELNRQITQLQNEYRDEKNYKAELVKTRDQLTEQIQYQIKIGEEAKRKLKE